MIALFGFRTARGSSTLGGADALLELKTQLESGNDAKSDVGTDGDHYSEARGHG